MGESSSKREKVGRMIIGAAVRPLGADTVERIAIGLLAAGEEDAWNAFVEAHPHGTPFHLTAWRDAVEETFGHDPHYLVARRGAGVVGVLPLFHVKSLLFGSMLVSVPFAVYGGVLATDGGAARQLEETGRGVAERLGVAYLELRDRQSAEERGGQRKELYSTFRKGLPKHAEELLSWVPRKTRRMVRLGIKAGLSGHLTRGRKGASDFYDLFAHNLRKLGTPALPKALVENLLRAFGDRSDILLIKHEGRSVAGVLNFYFRDEVLPYYSGADETLNGLGLNNFLYYDLMAKSIDRGYRLFDFGRSKEGTGPYDFKRHFGFEPQPLPYRYHLVRASVPPNLNPTNPKYRRAIELWKRLPLWVTTAVGPWIVRGIP